MVDLLSDHLVGGSRVSLCFSWSVPTLTLIQGAHPEWVLARTFTRDRDARMSWHFKAGSGWVRAHSAPAAA